jgi:hypothetical protein
MLRIRSCSVVVSIVGVVGMALCAQAFASDLTIPSGPRTSMPRANQPAAGKSNKDGRVPVTPSHLAQVDQSTLLIVPVSATKRAEKGKRKIRTYTLFHDPVFKLAGAVSSHSQMDARSGVAAPLQATAPVGLGRAYNGNVPVGLPAGMTMGGAIKSTLAESRAPALRMETADTGGGVEFACREKAFTPSYIRRDMSACYQSSLDKSWRTRTFVSKGITDGGREWGGGLSVIYAH